MNLRKKNHSCRYMPYFILAITAIFAVLTGCDNPLQPVANNIPESAILSGNVNEADGYTYLKNLSMVTVSISGTALFGVTDINGNYRIENIPAGAYTVMFNASEVTNRLSKFQRTPYGTTTNNFYYQDVELKSGENTCNLSIVVYKVTIFGPPDLILPLP